MNDSIAARIKSEAWVTAFGRESWVRKNGDFRTRERSGLVEGPNIKGQVQQSIKDEMASQAAEPADPLTSERLPKNQRDQAQQYFDALREGK